jgi:hypothetical protein
MTLLKARFDGKALIPQAPVNLPTDCLLEVAVRQAAPANDAPLMELVRALEGLPDGGDWPSDGAAQHDHYLYGTPKR